MTAQPDSAQEQLDLQKVSRILQWAGLGEVVIAVALAALMPSLIPGDPVSVGLGVIACAMVALCGVGLWAYARFVYGRRAGERKGEGGRPAGTVQRRGR